MAKVYDFTVVKDGLALSAARKLRADLNKRTTSRHTVARESNRGRVSYIVLRRGRRV